jgi:hypothetical protein
MEIVIGLVVGLALGFALASLGKKSVRAKEQAAAREELDRGLHQLAEALAGGRLPEGVSPGARPPSWSARSSAGGPRAMRSDGLRWSTPSAV